LVLLQFLAEPLVRLDRFFETDKAVGVDAAEVLLSAQPLAARDVAIPVDVSLAEPQRPRSAACPRQCAVPAQRCQCACQRAAVRATVARTSCNHNLHTALGL